jgi:outer membrane protein OmpA-like peptidoglycan-associated protein
VDGLNIVGEAIANPNDSISVNWNTYKVVITGQKSDGSQIKLNTNKSIEFVVSDGSSAVVTGSGFKPNSEVRIYLPATSYLLGSATTDANGSFTAKFVIPKDALLGLQYIQVNGYNSSDKIISGSVAVSLVKAKDVVKSQSASVSFASNSKTLSSATKLKLNNLISAIKAQSGFVQFKSITLTGFATPTKSLKNDTKLALARAAAIKQFLIDNAFTGEIILNPGARGSERKVTFVIDFTSKS